MLKPKDDAKSKDAQANAETLAGLRVEIDHIDEALHRLLIERGEIIDRLIQVKARQGGGSAFRPGREADMMRQIVERHHGLLPVDTVETIWRIIISTFTYVQAHYSVHVDCSGGDAIMRDCCRFHFGFTVPLCPHKTAATVIEEIKASKGDLGLVPVKANPATGAWWLALAEKDAPKIIARLPFIERPDHPAGLPLFVIAKPLADASSRDAIVYGVSLTKESPDLAGQLASIGVEILDKAATTEGGLSLLLEARGSADLSKIMANIDPAARIVELGSHAARFDLALSAQNAKKAQPTHVS